MAVKSNLTWQMIAESEKDYFGSKEFKFVVIYLSDGCRQIFVAPVTFGHQEIRHKKLVKQFCEQNGFSPVHCSDDGVITKAENAEGVVLQVKGGGTFTVRPKEYSLSEHNASADYGKPRCLDVAEVLQQLADESPKIWSIEIHDSK